MIKKKTIKSKKYFICFISISIIIFLSVGLINYFVDPQGYFKNDQNISKNQFIKLLKETQHGIIYNKETFNDRDIKISLAKYDDKFECAIIGSSHIFQISSIRLINPLDKSCTNIINLGVAGSSIEDIFIFSRILSQKKKNKNKIIYFNINPWTLNYNREVKWIKFKHIFNEMSKIINPKVSETYFKSNYFLDNILNIDYFYQSIHFLFNTNLNIKKAKSFDYNKGLKDMVILSDGSFVYSEKFISQNRKINKFLNYKIVDDMWYQDRVVNDFENLLSYLGDYYTIKIILTPYHPLIWSNPKQPLVKAMKIVEEKTLQIAKKNSIDVVGSFNPNNLNCLEVDFYDEMHSKPSCLKKIGNYLIDN